VEALRHGDLSPIEALEGTLAAASASGDLNAFSHVDADAARRAVKSADTSLPFGGVPVAIKELEAVDGWPDTDGSLVFADRTYDYEATQVRRLRRAGAVVFAQTTAPEFGGVNYTRTKIHGTTRNPWDPARTPGGSSGGSAAVVAGGIAPIASGSDGGGSIRIPAGFSGLVGLKSTYGRIPRGPRVNHPPHTVTVGCLARSVRDVARWFDVCNGYDVRDGSSLAPVSGWEAALGHRDTAGVRAGVVIDLGSAIVEPRQAALLTALAESVIKSAGLVRTEVDVAFPLAGLEWTLGNSPGLYGALQDKWPECAEDLTPAMRRSLEMALRRFDLASAAAAEAFRVDFNERAATIFDTVDVLFCATNPDVAFAAEGPMPHVVGTRDVAEEFGFRRAAANHGALTIPANLTGQPAISVPAGTIDGLPVGLQIIARHHEEPLLLELARVIERDSPWPLVAPRANEFATSS
jgi:Asp-tRNA(Asn)/Glu-tRNA(Gln) amidotransferase A subunit family amidase